MHMNIGVLVSADDAEDAFDIAVSATDELTRDQWPFDYARRLKGEDTDEGEIQEFAFQVHTEKHPADDKHGLEFVLELMEATKRDFMNNLKVVRNILSKFSDEELFEELEVENAEYPISPSNFRFRCSHLGQYYGSQIWLYDKGGSGIRTPDELKSILEHEYEDKPLWIVPFDVHY